MTSRKPGDEEPPLVEVTAEHIPPLSGDVADGAGLDALANQLSRELSAVAGLPRLAELLAPSQTQEVPAPSSPPAAASSVADERLNELAEDMLALMRRIRSLEAGQQQLVARLEQLVEQQAKGGHSFAREVDTLRRELLKDRRHSATADVIAELMPQIERMKTMHAHLDPRQDERMRAQLNGVLESLESCLRRLGGEPFTVETGTPFDAFQMQASKPCDVVGMVVAATLEPGMRCGQLILRRAMVQLKSRADATALGDSVDE